MSFGQQNSKFKSSFAGKQGDTSESKYKSSTRRTTRDILGETKGSSSLGKYNKEEEEQKEDEEEEQNQEEEEEGDEQTEESPEKDEKTPLLYVDVNLGPGSSERIVVCDGDTAESLADQFCQQHCKLQHVNLQP